MRLLVAVLAMGVAAFAQTPALKVHGMADRGGVPKPALELTLEQLKQMPRIALDVKNQKGDAEHYEGVAFSEVMKRAGLPMGEELRGPLLASCIVATAHDAYRVVLTLPDADPAFTDSRILIADSLNGAPLSNRDGPLRLIVPGDKRPARWLRMLEDIAVIHIDAPLR